jgi:uncharacterized membrane protein (Fun14 family)
MADPPAESTAPFGKPAAASFDWLALARGLAGAVVGGIVGFIVFRWLASMNLLAHMVPGVLLGIAAGWAARRRIHLLGAICAIAALGLTIVAEWSIAPFNANETLAYFITHLTEMDHARFKLIAIGLGAAAAYWFGQGR